MKQSLAALMLAGMLATIPGCGGSEEQSSEEETLPELSPSTQPSPRTTQASLPSERYEGLETREPAEFENGLTAMVEEAFLAPVPAALSEELEPEDLLLVARFRLENVNPEGQTPSRTFNVTTALWQARDQNGNVLRTLYPLETSLIVGELPYASPDYPYLEWQGELRAGEKRQGSMLFAVPPSAKVWVRFTHPVMGPAPTAEWELGPTSELPQAPAVGGS